MLESYQPTNEMSLWWLGRRNPEMPHRLIGRLFLSDGNRKVGLEYSKAWLQEGFQLSDDLPLAANVFLPKERDMAAGAVDDARPDQWGERVIRNIYKPSRLSVLEYLYFAGDDRFGALGVSPVSNAYQPSALSPIAKLGSLPAMERAIAAVLANEPMDEEMVRLVRPGPSFGGARPKSLIEMDGAPWVVKFSAGEELDTELVEHATMSLAAECGIWAATTRALPLDSGHAVAVRRFDRDAGASSHVISANTVLRAAGLPLGYPELAQTLRRIARADAIKENQEQLFRRMVFNILMDNTDDHEKNHALIRSSDGYYGLSPAYDVVPSAQGLGQQQLRVGTHEAESSLENALSEVESFGLNRATATAIVRQVATVVDGWRAQFQSSGVSERDIEELAQYIDGPSLKPQRVEFAERSSHHARCGPG